MIIEITNQDLIDGRVPEEKLTGATKVKFSNCINLKSLPNFPESVINIDVHNCNKLEDISTLARLKNLKELNLSQCYNLKSIPKLPEDLIELNLSQCYNLKSIPKLPETLKLLDLSGCYKLENLAELPVNLKELNLSRCISINSIESFPEHLEKLNLSQCHNLKSIPKLPETLKLLDLSGCYNLENLAELPVNLKELNLSGCHNLKSIPKLPEDLIELNLSGCRALKPTIELLEKLDILGQRGCIIIFPSHFNPDKLIENIQNRLEILIEKHKKDLSTEAIHSIRTVFHRYLTEDIDKRIEERYNIKQAFSIFKFNIISLYNSFINSTQPILDFIEKNPNSLSWISDVCSDHDTGSINQPVFAFAKINALIEIAKQETLKDKIVSARYLYTLQHIISVVCSEASKPGAQPRPDSLGNMYEAEAVNMVLINLHQELLDNGSIPTRWQGVPEKIADEGTVTPWFNSFKSRGKIDELVKTFKDFNSKEFAEFILNAEFEKWWKVAFSDDVEIKKVIQEYNERIIDTEGDKLISLRDERTAKIQDRIRSLTANAFAEIETSSLSPESSLERISIEALVSGTSVSKKRKSSELQK